MQVTHRINPQNKSTPAKTVGCTQKSPTKHISTAAKK